MLHHVVHALHHVLHHALHVDHPMDHHAAHVLQLQDANLDAQHIHLAVLQRDVNHVRPSAHHAVLHAAHKAEVSWVEIYSGSGGIFPQS